ncbi:type IV pilus biogenesis/stability protein PilW [Pseudoalteromonas aliena]|uniref:LysM domain-containing protein n=1 Tax=Pseudoalteromonas aliena SW19 TaxID=1314866 RepID=A0ABR9E3W6_9GAMM|nr:type IV pilus biogenesis/stability protein PilW [Pseudoalteromonas aliena]MBE0361292.1 hypothetical protein [Pseudoalteromonas aliena SW19]
MRSILALTISAIALSGCVTESSYNGSNKPVVENKINNIGAARTRIALALQYLNTGNNSQAKYNLERAAGFAPQLPEVHYSLAYYYQQVGENTLADKAYQKALAIKPDDPNTLNNYGVFLCGINEYDRATDQFLKAIEVPSYIRVAESYENLALCAIEFNDFDNAESYFQQAMNHSSQRTSTLISLAALFYAKSDLHKASELLKRHDDTGQISARALMLEYLIKSRMGRIEEAEKISATIVQIYPTSNEAYSLREQKTRLSEFEILRDKYRRAMLDDLQQSNNNGRISSEPKIKIIRKKSPTLDSSTSLISNDSKGANAATSVSQNQVNEHPAHFKASPANSIKTENNKPPQVKSIPAGSIVVNVPSEPEKKTIPVTFSNTATDTSAVISALTSQQSSAKKVTVSQEAVSQTSTKKNSNELKTEVKIISFGESKAIDLNSQQKNQIAHSNTESSNSNNGANVTFYEAVKNGAVFSNSKNESNEDVEFTNYSAIKKIDAPLLSTKVPVITVPSHIITFGENLFSISVRYNVKLQKLLQWNGLKESDRVMNGSKIYLNDPNIYYEIKAGDTLYKIATQRHVLIDQLMRWNKLSPDTELKSGHRLLLVDPESYLL